LQEAIANAQLGRWEEAAAAYDRAIELNPANHDRWVYSAALHAATGDVEGYRRVCHDMLERFRNADHPQTAERTVKACLLIPDALSDADSDLVQKLAERAVTGTEKDGYDGFFAMAKGLADYRARRYEEAIKWMERAAPDVDGIHWDVTKFAVIAVAHHGLGATEEADAALAKAKAIVAKIPDPAKGQLFGAGDWHDWLYAQILFREAETLLVKPAM
jgi:tetratricopeptide (TPR) repeat protein